MLFNSYSFILVFLPITVIGYYTVLRLFPSCTYVNEVYLLIASVIFYSSSNLIYLPILVLSILVNYYISNWIRRFRDHKKMMLTIGLVFNLGLLGYFKYLNFAIEQIQVMDLHLAKIVMPLGISFYTFTQIGYLIDIYRGNENVYSLLEYSLFVSIFPQISSGPILDHKEMIPQFSDAKRKQFNLDCFVSGIFMFSIGLIKKVMLSDYLSPIANQVFTNSTSLTMPEAWIGVLAYALQIYFDFSGYSDMVLGVGRMLNLEFPLNFDTPYQAESIIDFWRRWHISLSNWIKKYVYISFGGNRNGELRKYVNLVLSMILCGVWHGAGWNFLIWGLLQGIFLTINHLWRKTGKHIQHHFAHFITLCSVLFGWIIFRAESMNQFGDIIWSLFNFNNFVFGNNTKARYGFLQRLHLPYVDTVCTFVVPEVGLKILVLILIVLFIPASQKLVEKVMKNRSFAVLFGIVMGLFIAYILLSLGEVDTSFIYTNF